MRKKADLPRVALWIFLSFRLMLCYVTLRYVTLRYVMLCYAMLFIYLFIYLFFNVCLFSVNHGSGIHAGRKDCNFITTPSSQTVKGGCSPVKS